MDGSQDSILASLGPAQDSDERKTAIEHLVRNVDHCSPEQLDTASQLLTDLFSEQASVSSRCLGFNFLEAVLTKETTPVDQRRRFLQAVIHPIGPDGLLYQLQTIANTFEACNSLAAEGEGERVVDYLSACITAQFKAKRSARDRIKNEPRSASKDMTVEDKGLNKLFAVLIDLVSRLPRQAVDERAGALYNASLWIVEKASDTTTVEQICVLIQHLIELSGVPDSVMKRCIEDLCATYSTTPNLQELTRACFQSLIGSNPEARDDILGHVFFAIASPPQERVSYTTSGAIKVCAYMLAQNSSKNSHNAEFSRMIDALADADFSSRSICRETIRTISTLLRNDKLNIELTNDATWESMLHILNAACGSPDKEVITKLTQPATPSPTPSILTEEASRDDLRLIAEHYMKRWGSYGAARREAVTEFLVRYQDAITSEAICSFLRASSEDGSFEKTNEDFLARRNEIVNSFYMAKATSAAVRIATVEILSKTFASLTDHSERLHWHQLLLRIMAHFPDARDTSLANAIGLLIIQESVHEDSPTSFLDDIIGLVWPLLRAADGVIPQDGQGQPTEVVPSQSVDIFASMIEVFVKCLEPLPEKAVRIFELLLSIARDQHLSSKSRLAAMKLLSRLRCDPKNNILLPDTVDLQDLPAIIHRATKAESALSRDTSALTFEKADIRSPRNSMIGLKSSVISKEDPRSSLKVEPQRKTSIPLWNAEEEIEISRKLSSTSLTPVFVSGEKLDATATLHIGEWLVVAISILQQPNTDWELYSYVITHLPAQLSNRQLFAGSMPHIGMLRRILVDQLLDGKVYEPPREARVRKGDVALCLYHALTLLIGYSENIERREQERIVQTFFHGISEWERTSLFCIRALTVCCYVLPTAIITRLSAILQKMSQVVTQAHLTVDILEFLAGLARLRHLYVNFREEEYRTVFAICVRYLEHSREQRTRLLTHADFATSNPSKQTDQHGHENSPTKPDLYEDLPQYVFALAYQVITIWFLSLKINYRHDYVGWITRNLSWTDESGVEIMEEQSQVTLDMMLRTSYLNLGETAPGNPFSEKDGPILSKTWLVGLSIVTVETAVFTGVSRLTKRQASGTTYAVYYSQNSDLPPHHEALADEGLGSNLGFSIFPNHVLLQLMSSISPKPAPMEPICLPEEDFVKRALAVFDRNDTVDGYKVGILYVGDGQDSEATILSNSHGSAAYETFLEGLGTKIELRGAKFNTQGLDRGDDFDGTHTYAWRDRITEIVFHVATMMPTNLETDPQSVNKKRHIGNDYVKIIWNESGIPFRFDTLPSQFNCVNIVITPSGSFRSQSSSSSYAPPASSSGADIEQCYIVQTVTADNFPDLSAAAQYKLLALKDLAVFVRQLALQASVFSNVWMNRDTGEHASSWRNRLREIKQLRNRYANTGTSTSAKFPGATSSRKYSQGDVFNGVVTMGGLAEHGEGLAASLDFSRWAGAAASLQGAGKS